MAGSQQSIRPMTNIQSVFSLLFCLLTAVCRSTPTSFGAHVSHIVPPELLDVALVPSSVLGLCEGDCDSNDDCDEGLLCFERDEEGDLPPGCSGTATGDWDYCYEAGTGYVGMDLSERFPLSDCIDRAVAARVCSPYNYVYCVLLNIYQERSTATAFVCIMARRP